MSLNPLSRTWPVTYDPIILPLTPDSTYTSTSHLSCVLLGDKESPKNDRLQKLPPSLSTYVMTYLSPYQICVLTSISSLFYSYVKEDRWGPLCQQIFPESYKNHAEYLKSSPQSNPLPSRHLFMRQLNPIKDCLNLNTQQKSDFIFVETLSKDLVLLEYIKDNSLILWNIKKGVTIKRWEKSDPIRRLFGGHYPNAQKVLDGRPIFHESGSCGQIRGINVYDLIGNDKTITLPLNDMIKTIIGFSENRIIYHNFESGIWIWDVFKGTSNILLSETPTLEVNDVHLLDDNHIITSSEKTLKDTARKITELAVWHVSSQQIIKTCTEATRITSDPVVVNKRWVVYTTKGDNKVKVWDTLNDKKSNFPISSEFSNPTSSEFSNAVALNERLVMCRMQRTNTFKIIDVLEGRQRDIPNPQDCIKFIPLSNEFGIFFAYHKGLTIWDDSAHHEALLKGTHSSPSSSSSDTSSSSSSSSNTPLTLPDLISELFFFSGSHS